MNIWNLTQYRLYGKLQKTYSINCSPRLVELLSVEQHSMEVTFFFCYFPVIYKGSGESGESAGSPVSRTTSLHLLWSQRAVHGQPDKKHVSTHCGKNQTFRY